MKLLVVEEHLVVVVGDRVQHGDGVFDWVKDDQEPFLGCVLVVVDFLGVPERNRKEDVDGDVEHFALKLCSSEGGHREQGVEEEEQEVGDKEAGEDDGVHLHLL